MKINPNIWKRQKESYIKRNVAVKDQRCIFLIFCEGERTEPNYFKKFKIDRRFIRVFGTATNTVSLVKKAIQEVKNAKKEDIIYDQVWCVFDKDDFLDANFNNAISKATANKIRVAYSNEAFELWYILHFDYLDSAISRAQYIPILSAKLGKKYEKNSETIYEELLSKQKDAIRNAKRLYAEKNNTANPSKSKPCTTVFMLVEELNKHL